MTVLSGRVFFVKSGRLKLNGEDKGDWSLSSATTSTEPSCPSFSHNTSSLLGTVGMLSLTSSTAMMTVPVPVLEPEMHHYDVSFGTKRMRAWQYQRKTRQLHLTSHENSVDLEF